MDVIDSAGDEQGEDDSQDDATDDTQDVDMIPIEGRQGSLFCIYHYPWLIGWCSQSCNFLHYVHNPEVYIKFEIHSFVPHLDFYFFPKRIYYNVGLLATGEKISTLFLKFCIFQYRGINMRIFFPMRKKYAFPPTLFHPFSIIFSPQYVFWPYFRIINKSFISEKYTFMVYTIISKQVLRMAMLMISWKKVFHWTVPLRS